MYEQKIRYDGRRLAQKVPAAFGMFLDYARSLPADSLPEYADWQKRLGQCTWDRDPVQPWKPQRALSGME